MIVRARYEHTVEKGITPQAFLDDLNGKVASFENQIVAMQREINQITMERLAAQQQIKSDTKALQAAHFKAKEIKDRQILIQTDENQIVAIANLKRDIQRLEAEIATKRDLILSYQLAVKQAQQKLDQLTSGLDDQGRLPIYATKTGIVIAGTQPQLNEVVKIADEVTAVSTCEAQFDFLINESTGQKFTEGSAIAFELDGESYVGTVKARVPYTAGVKMENLTYEEPFSTHTKNSADRKYRVLVELDAESKAKYTQCNLSQAPVRIKVRKN